MLLASILLKSFGDKTIRVFGLKLWNRLPLIIRMERSFENFKKSLNTHLFYNVFKPTKLLVNCNLFISRPVLCTYGNNNYFNILCSMLYVCNCVSF